MDISKLTPQDREEVHDHLREAIYHLCECWDALGTAEDTLGKEQPEPPDIKITYLQRLAGECPKAHDAFKVTAEQLDALLEGLEVPSGAV